MSDENPLEWQVKPVTARIFGDDLLEFQENIVSWKRRLRELSIGEGESINAAILLVNTLVSPERRAEEAKRLELTKEQATEFDNVCEWIMDVYVNALTSVMSRRDESDKRKNPVRRGKRSAGEPTDLDE